MKSKTTKYNPEFYFLMSPKVKGNNKRRKNKDMI